MGKNYGYGIGTDVNQETFLELYNSTQIYREEEDDQSDFILASLIMED